MLHQKVGTAAGSGILVILAVTAIAFVLVHEKIQTNTMVMPQQALLLPEQTKDDICRHGKEYHNAISNYTITLPSESWCLPSESDDDPHITSIENCFEYDYLQTESTDSCLGLEIQDHGSSSEQGNQIEFKMAAKDASRHPNVLESFIPGATVIKSDALMMGSPFGWRYEYIVLFSKEQRQFLIFSNDESVESIIKTFVLDK